MAAPGVCALRAGEDGVRPESGRDSGPADAEAAAAAAAAEDGDEDGGDTADGGDTGDDGGGLEGVAPGPSGGRCPARG